MSDDDPGDDAGAFPTPVRPAAPTTTCIGVGERVRLTVAEVARVVDHRLHHESLHPDSLARSVRLAVEYGVGAITCRPADVAAVATHVREHASRTGIRWRATGRTEPAPSGHTPPIGVATALEFERGAASVAELLAQARDLTLAGATELALAVDGERLPVTSVTSDRGVVNPATTGAPGGRVGARDGRAAVATLVEAQPRYQFRLRVQLETGGMTDDAVRRACESLRAAGVWMVQAGTWHGPRTSFRQIRVMREALGEQTRLKWTSPVSSLHGMLLAIAEGVDRFNADDTFAVLRAAEHHARYGPILVPRAGLDY